MASDAFSVIFEYVLLGMRIWVLYELIMFFVSIGSAFGKGKPNPTSETPELTAVKYRGITKTTISGHTVNKIDTFVIEGKHLDKLSNPCWIECTPRSPSHPAELIVEESKLSSLDTKVVIDTIDPSGNTAILHKSVALNLVTDKEVTFEATLADGSNTHNSVTFKMIERGGGGGSSTGGATAAINRTIHFIDELNHPVTASLITINSVPYSPRGNSIIAPLEEKDYQVKMRFKGDNYIGMLRIGSSSTYKMKIKSLGVIEQE